jgi:hypothetical protein
MIIAKVLRDEDGLNKDEMYEVEHVSMGQSYTSIYLSKPKEGTKNPFNSVIFDFFENDEELDIYSDSRFNPYI